MHPQPDAAGYHLQSLLPYLETEYCTRIECFCERARQHIAELSSGDAHQEASLYTSTCKHLIDQTTKYVGMHRLALVPYIHQLLGKKIAGTTAVPVRRPAPSGIRRRF